MRAGVRARKELARCVPQPPQPHPPTHCRRVRGDPYYELLDEFLTAVRRRYGNTTLLHFEDMAFDTSSKLLSMYRTAFPCFSDDMSAEAAVLLAAVLAALPKTGGRLGDHTFVFAGEHAPWHMTACGRVFEVWDRQRRASAGVPAVPRPLCVVWACGGAAQARAAARRAWPSSLPRPSPPSHTRCARARGETPPLPRRGKR